MIYHLGCFNLCVSCVLSVSIAYIVEPASGSVIFTFQGSTTNADIPGSTNDFTMRFHVDNGGAGSLINQDWDRFDLVAFELSSGTYQWTAQPLISQSAFDFSTDLAGNIDFTSVQLVTAPTGGDTVAGLAQPRVDPFTAEAIRASDSTLNLLDIPTLAALKDPLDHSGWQVRVDPAKVIPEPASMLVWMLFLTVGLGVSRGRRR